MLKTGCQWRMLPHDFAPWNTVYYYSQWRDNGLIEEIHEALRNLLRIKSGRQESLSAACIDSRLVKTTRSGGESRGVDGGKNKREKTAYCYRYSWITFSSSCACRKCS